MQESRTFRRVFKSRHVRDLLIIAGGTLLLMIGAMSFVVRSMLTNPDTLSELGKIGAVLAAGGAVIAWAYRTASTRLGVVDLFASEIATLCRVGTISRVVEQSIGQWQSGPPPQAGLPAPNAPEAGPAFEPHRFTSQENYFPVFEANSRDLQILEADVVINVTAFYTYMKVVRDQARRLVVVARDPNAWQETWLNIIYMLFLAYETARLAVNDLVEFEPTHAERTIAILLTEIVAFRFLRDNVKQDYRLRRLDLRQPKYKELGDGLHCKLQRAIAKKDLRFEQAIVLWDELRGRYQSELGIPLAQLPGAAA
jgi:hypothetical protein